MWRKPNDLGGQFSAPGTALTPSEFESMLASAKSALDAEKWQEAEGICRRILGSDRANGPATLLLGLVAAKTYRIPLAVQLLRSAFSSDPSSFEAAYWLGLVLRMSGDVVEGVKVAARAVELRPRDALAHANLANCYSLLDQTQNSIASLERAIELDPANAEFLQNLGVEFERLNRDEEALASYRKAVDLAPSAPNSMVSLGRMLRDRKLVSEADEWFDRAFEAVSSAEDGYLRLAHSLFDEGLPEPAEKCLRLALQREPDSAAAQSLLGSVLLQLGRFDEAVVALERAIELEPRDIWPYINLIGSRKTREEDRPRLELMATMLRAQGHTADNRRSIHYALGKAYDDLKDYRRAMQHFDEANGMMQMQLSGRRFDRKAHSATVNRMITLFTKKSFAESDNLGVDSDKPILIVGMIRSGTTLLEQIVSSHPDVAAGGELSFLLQRYQRVLMPQEGSTPRTEALELAADYLKLLESIGGDKAHVTDKMPHNFMLLGMVHAIFPNARIIHCRRHPVDTCISIYTTAFPQPLNFAHSQDEIVFFYKEYMRMMEHWRRVLPANRFLEVDYEDVISNREETTRRMIDFCGLTWDDACMHHDRNDAAIRTPSWWQARQPTYSSSIGRWKNYEPWLEEFRELL